MSIPKFLLPGLLLLLSVQAVAQNGEVEGYVNGLDGKGIQNAVVSFDQSDFHVHSETKTNKRGYFVFQSLLHGEYLVTVTVDGQVRDKRDKVHVSPGKQDISSGSMPLLVFQLKPPEVFAAEQQMEAAKGISKEEADKIAKAREDELRKQMSRNDYYGAGKTAMDAKQYDVAVDHLTKAAATDPKQPAIWSMLADAYMAVARQQTSAEAAATYQKAYDAFGRAIGIAPKNAGNYNNFALALAASGKLDEARQNLAKAIALDPQDAGKYHYNLGAFLINASQIDAAVEEFRKAVEADPDFAEAWFYIGSTLAGKSTLDASGNMAPPAGTIEALRKYLSLKPDGPDAPAAKALIAALGSGVDMNKVNSKKAR